jgi:hypothetical protein
MPKQVFVNLPVKDLERSKSFFGALGFGFNPNFTDANAACMIIEDGSNYDMLLVEPFFSTFTKKPIVDARTSTEVLIALSLENRGAVDAMVAKARAAGGTVPNQPKDYGLMYQHGFDDLDGHSWEVFFMSGDPPAA